METGFWKFIWRFNALVIAFGASLIVGVILWELSREFRRETFPVQTTNVVTSPASQNSDTSQQRQQTLRYGAGQPIVGTDQYRIPVYRDEVYPLRGISKSSNGSLVDFVILDMKTSATRLVFGEEIRVILDQTDLRATQPDGTTRVIATILRVVETDTNENGQLSNADTATLYIVDASWENLVTLDTDVTGILFTNAPNSATFDIGYTTSTGSQVKRIATSTQQVIFERKLPLVD